MAHDTPDIVVLRDRPHGLPTPRCAEALAERLPECDVRTAATPAEERGLVTDTPVALGLDIGEELVERADELEYFGCGSAGVGHLPMDAWRPAASR